MSGGIYIYLESPQSRAKRVSLLPELDPVSRARAFLDKYGDKAFMLLRACLDVALDPNVDHRLGDFSFKHVVMRLSRLGLRYNPSNLLRAMEREYGLIEKSYASSNQTWWRFVDLEAVRQALGEPGAAEDPEASLLKIKYRSLEPERIKSALSRLALKPQLTQADKEAFKRLAFGELEDVVRLYKEMEGREELFYAELQALREILRLAELVSLKLEQRARPKAAAEAEALEEREARVNDTA